MTFDNLLAFLAFVSLVIVFYYNYKKEPRDKSTIIVALIGAAVFVTTLFKNCSNEKSTLLSTNRNDTLRHKIDSIKNVLTATMDTCSSNNNKLDVLNVYVHRLDSIGIKRDTVTNMPQNVFNIKRNGIININ